MELSTPTLHQLQTKPTKKKESLFHPISCSALSSPGEIYGHTSISYLTRLFVFGGSDNNGKFSRDVYIYSVESKSWVIIPSKEDSPKGRHFHTAILWKKGMYIFGGKSNGYMNDFFRFDLEDHTWSVVEVLSGRPPSKRYGHSAVLWGNSMWIYGGYDDFGYKSDELFQYRFDSKIWNKIQTYVAEPKDGSPPLKLEKYQHTAVVTNDAMYVFGGRGENKEQFTNDLIQYSFGTRTWARVCVKGKVPSPRWGHRAIIYKGKMYLTGGCDYVLNFNDVFKFNFGTFSWSKLDVGDFDPRFFHSSEIINHSMYILAGRNIHNYLFDGLYKYCFDIYKEKSPNTFNKDIKEMLTHPENSDIVFCFPQENNKMIYAHKGILIARSETFKIMFKSGMKESKETTKAIKITDRYQPFFVLITYLYTGTIGSEGSSFSDIVQLFMLADRYLLQHLKFKCEILLKQYIAKDTLLQLYDVAVNCHAEQLKHFCAKFAAKFYEVLDNKTWPKTLKLETQMVIEKLKKN